MVDVLKYISKYTLGNGKTQLLKMDTFKQIITQILSHRSFSILSRSRRLEKELMGIVASYITKNICLVTTDDHRIVSQLYGTLGIVCMASIDHKSFYILIN